MESFAPDNAGGGFGGPEDDVVPPTQPGKPRGGDGIIPETQTNRGMVAEWQGQDESFAPEISAGGGGGMEDDFVPPTQPGKSTGGKGVIPESQLVEGVMRMCQGLNESTEGGEGQDLKEIPPTQPSSSVTSGRRGFIPPTQPNALLTLRPAGSHHAEVDMVLPHDGLHATQASGVANNQLHDQTPGRLNAVTASQVGPPDPPSTHMQSSHSLANEGEDDAIFEEHPLIPDTHHNMEEAARKTEGVVAHHHALEAESQSQFDLTPSTQVRKKNPSIYSPKGTCRLYW